MVKKIKIHKQKEKNPYLKSTSVKPFDGNYNWITLSIRGLNGSFINTSKTPFSNLKHPIKTIGSISKFLKSENSEALLFLSIQILHTPGRRYRASRVCCPFGRGTLVLVLVLQFRSWFGFLFEEETLHFVIMKLPRASLLWIWWMFCRKGKGWKEKKWNFGKEEEEKWETVIKWREWEQRRSGWDKDKDGSVRARWRRKWKKNMKKKQRPFKPVI